MKLLVAVNPASGGVDKTDSIDLIRTYCRESDVEIVILMLTGKADHDLIRNHIRTDQPDRLVAMGGDGTIKLVAELAIEANLPLGILPTGSANGMAREMGLPLDLKEAVAVTTGDLEQPVDVLNVNNEICLHLSDIGLNAQLVKYYQQNNWRGMFGYARGVVRVLLRRRTMQVTICTPKEEFTRQAEMVVLANASTYGTGAVINPDGELNDGKFEVVLLRRLVWSEILKMFWRFRPYDPAKTEVFPARSVHIETRRKAYFQVDGEYRGRVSEINADVMPGALRVLLPKRLGQQG